MKLTIPALLITTLLLAASAAQAGVHVNVGFGGGYYGGGYYRGYYAGYPYYGYPYPYYYPPAAPVYYSSPPVVYGDAPAPTYAPQPTYASAQPTYAAPQAYDAPESSSAPVQTVVTTPSSAPYGSLASAGVVKSPWSDFTISKSGHEHGQTVFDANNGKAFRIP